MSFFRSIIRSVIILACFSILPCLAQGNGDVTLRFVLFPHVGDAQPLHLAIGESETVEIEARSNSISEPVVVPRMSQWIFGEIQIDADDGNEVLMEIGRAPSIDSPNQLIVLVRKGRANSDGLEAISVDNRVSGFTGGDFMFLNASRFDIGGQVGTATFAIEPGKHRIVTPRLEAGQRLLKAEMFVREDNSARPFFVSSWPVSDISRGIIFFYNDPLTDRIRFHTIRDFP